MKLIFLLPALVCPIILIHAETTNSFPLWTNGAPGALGQEDKDIPTLTAYFPEPAKASGAAIVICPGGGYGDIGHSPDVQAHSGIPGAVAVIHYDASTASHDDSVARRIRYIEPIKKYVLGLVDGNSTVNRRSLPSIRAQIKRVLTKQGDTFIAGASYEDGCAWTRI